ncbi:glutamine amidotransferase-related protein [Microvirga alba]|uniref:Gamma-glutamyl-gamma-aminobutyrate hydrolase family protein n=1 Tax=Microvirga alba TaxID=2791025 RepID=A0A931FMJ0_9HYPH|nr:gamma-glutamyl-gamma-aminobutyrate hydrolase family protein [Microvirga alba]MBF9232595.1 gamma-glutamyl-gamma-aminobutyrate hydrolase family protein [Microvirga alba]
MRIGILETGRNREHLTKRHGTYIDMFSALLSAVDPSLEFTSYGVLEDEWPASIHECDAWLLTGSRHTAFDRLPWMVRLEELLREMMAAGKPIIGICFGHQILAQALGGKVERAKVGWGLGPHSYSVDEIPEWMEGAPETICLNAVHQDQVTELPEGATVIASSPFCQNAILAYGDRALTFQAHPEFAPEFLAELLDALESNGLPKEVIADARTGLGNAERKTESTLAAQWVLNFLAGRIRA